MGDASLAAHPVLSGVSTGYPGEGGWLHTRYAPVRHSRGPEGPLTVRLACIRPAASVHPEPGSNSSLYYCLAYCFSLNLGFRLDVLLCLPFLKVPCLARRRAALVLCWPQTVKELRKLSLTKPFFLCLRAAKVRPFPKLAMIFLNIFQKILQVVEIKIDNNSIANEKQRQLHVFGVLDKPENSVLARLYDADGAYKDEIGQNSFSSSLIDMCHLLEFG